MGVPTFADLTLAVLRSDLPRDERFVLVVLLSFADWGTWAPVRKTIGMIAQRSGFSERTVSNTLKTLAGRKLIKNIAPHGWLFELELATDLISALPESLPPATFAGPPATIAGGGMQPLQDPPQPLQEGGCNLCRGGMQPLQGGMQPLQDPPATIATISGSSSRSTIPDLLPDKMRVDPTQDVPSFTLTSPEHLKDKPKQKAATQKRLPLQPVKPPDMDPTLKALPHGRLLAALWYGTEVRRKEGPDREVFQTFANLLAEWSKAAGETPAIDRRGYTPIRETIDAWRAAGRSESLLLEACRVKPDPWENARGMWTLEYQFGSVKQVNKTLARRDVASGNQRSTTDDLGRMQSGFTVDELAEIWERNSQ